MLISSCSRNCVALTLPHIRNIKYHRRSHHFKGVSSYSTEVKDPFHGSYHWYFERIVAAGTMVTLGSMIALPSASHVVDASLMVLLPVHIYNGFSAVILDYLPKRKFGVVYTIFKGSLIVITGVAVFGLYKFNTENIGISEAVRKLWHQTGMEE